MTKIKIEDQEAAIVFRSDGSLSSYILEPKDAGVTPISFNAFLCMMLFEPRNEDVLTMLSDRVLALVQETRTTSITDTLKP